EDDAVVVQRGLGRDFVPAHVANHGLGVASQGVAPAPPPVVRIRMTSPAVTGAASTRASTSHSFRPPGAIGTWHGRPALPPVTHQQARIERSAMDMKWPSLSMRMCFS